MTAPRFSFRRVAVADLAAAYRHDESEEAGLGEEFLQVVADAVSGAATEPARYPVMRADVRRVLVRRFP